MLGASFRLVRVRRHLRTSGNAVLNLEPLTQSLRNGSPHGVGPIEPNSSAVPACNCAWP